MIREEPKLISFNADWKDSEGLILSIDTALRDFGLKIVDDPALEGSDVIGGYITQVSTTQEEADQLIKDNE